MLLAVLAVASGLPACIDPLGDFGKDDCRTDADCPSELTCIDGMFGTFCGCDDDGDCRDGSHCRWGICADNCLFEYECQPSETCWQGKCQAGCQNDQGCEAGFRCTSEGALGKCAPACFGASDCPDGACVCGLCALDCSGTATCPNGLSCEPTKCNVSVCLSQ